MSDAAQTYAPGDLVRVLDGPFLNYEARVRSVDTPKARLEVAVTVAGRAFPILVEAGQVERVSQTGPAPN